MPEDGASVVCVCRNLFLVQVIVLEEQGGVGGLDLGGVEADLLLQDVVNETAQGHGVHVAYELQAGTTAHHALDVWPIRVDGLQQPVVALMLLHEGVLVSGRGARRVDTPLAAAIAVSTAVDSHLLLGYTRAKHLERLDDDEPPDDGVSGGHGVHDITCHSLGVEETLRRNVVVGRTQQRRRSHKLHGEGVVLVELVSAPSAGGGARQDARRR
mmetsp:Transcript_46865/g.74993  ORF Transcript_46865/g.74993 Transcript_46865/m.74993 type:complete len:213 (+) Transcript_46865:67-705(+)